MSLEQIIDEIIEKTAKNIVLAIPLGLGKPNQFVNAIYNRAKQDSSIKLTIITALSLTKPVQKQALAKRLADPILERIFTDYVELDYIKDSAAKKLPDNIVLKEFFFQPGSQVKNSTAQQQYISSNYTHVARDLLNQGINVTAQMVAKRELPDGEVQYSLSCNPEVTLDVEKLLQQRNNRDSLIVIAQVNENLPFMVNDAIVDAQDFDYLIDDKAHNTALFATPNNPVGLVDHAIGFHASTLVKDAGTLQIGIGSLGDAIANNLITRHQHNDDYQKIFEQQDYAAETLSLIDEIGGLSSFEQGLLGTSEMFVPGFMELRNAGIIKREVYNHLGLQTLINQKKISKQLKPDTLEIMYQEGYLLPVLTPDLLLELQHYGILSDALSIERNQCIDSVSGKVLSTDLTDADNRAELAQLALGNELKNGHFMQGGFFLGHNGFYDYLRQLPESERGGINMTNISYINDVVMESELKFAQRQQARYLNTVFHATLLGASAADMFEDGKVLSGVGGQYNFVAQAHEVPDGRSILMLRSTFAKKQTSNILFNYGHNTIPRHLRDIYITEYGVADLRSKSDADIVKAMLNISDSRFQADLMSQAKAAGKLEAGYQIPERYRNNTPESLAERFKFAKQAGYFAAFPFGSDLTDEEITLGKCLRKLEAQSSTKLGKLKVALKLLTAKPSAAEQPYLQRMGLSDPQDFNESMLQRQVVLALRS